MTVAEKARRARRMAYLRRECPALFEAGLSFTAEQRAILVDLARGDIAGAQRIILNQLEEARKAAGR
jgi:hypothetical protein